MNDVLGKALIGLLLGAALPAAALAQSTALLASAPQQASMALAEDPVMLVEVSEWRAYAAGLDTDRVCYVTHAPAALVAQLRRERRPMLYVTHRPSRSAFDVVSFAAGYRFRADSLARISFAGGPTYRLFTSGDFAWAAGDGDDHKIVKALTEFALVTVTGVAQDGHLYTDTLTLAGFAATFQRASSDCRRAGAPLRR